MNVYEVTCPACGAPPHRACTSATGTRTYPPHEARRDRLLARKPGGEVSDADKALLAKIAGLGGLLVHECRVGGYCWGIRNVKGSRIGDEVVTRWRRAGLVESTGGRRAMLKLTAAGLTAAGEGGP